MKLKKYIRIHFMYLPSTILYTYIFFWKLWEKDLFGIVYIILGLLVGIIICNTPFYKKWANKYGLKKIPNFDQHPTYCESPTTKSVLKYEIPPKHEDNP